jgi:organic hydroperoxide reductase OsmC/OhrA
MILEKARVEITSYESEAEGVLGMVDDKHSAITGITIRPKVGLKNESDRSKLPQLYQKTEEYCVVGNSFNFKIKIET